MDSETASTTKVPWNKGKIVGQKAPLKLKDGLNNSEPVGVASR